MTPERLKMLEAVAEAAEELEDALLDFMSLAAETGSEAISRRHILATRRLDDAHAALGDHLDRLHTTP